MKKLTLYPVIDQIATEIFIGENLQIKELLKPHLGNMVLVADSAIRDLYAADLAKELHAQLLSIESGEKAKTKKTLEHLLEQFFQMGMSRDSFVLAMGGGATTDLVGFAASIYMRGVPLILMPTTLLGMVDAAIGGKTAIDTPFGKNLIGTLYHPRAIFIDFKTLKTLPSREKLNGFAEILKMGLIYDETLWAMDFTNQVEDLVIKAMEAKVAIVEKDPMEKGMRRILNFGHTIGHALEVIAEYKIAHGQAVALGSLTEAHLSMQLGYLAKEEFEKIQEKYHLFSLQLPKSYTEERLFQAMAHDKKKTKGWLRFVLIEKIGHALSFNGEYCRPVSQEELNPTLRWMEKTYG